MKLFRVGTETGSMSHAVAPSARRTICGVRVTPMEKGKPFDPKRENTCSRCIDFVRVLAEQK